MKNDKTFFIWNEFVEFLHSNFFIFLHLNSFFTWLKIYELRWCFRSKILHYSREVFAWLNEQLRNYSLKNNSKIRI